MGASKNDFMDYRAEQNLHDSLRESIEYHQRRMDRIQPTGRKPFTTVRLVEGTNDLYEGVLYRPVYNRPGVYYELAFKTEPTFKNKLEALKAIRGMFPEEQAQPKK